MRGDVPSKDPVCGMTVDPATAAHRTGYHGRQHYFCSAGCQTKFEADPERYVAPAPRAAPPSRERERSIPARCIRKSGRSARQLPDLRHGTGAGRGHGR